jgi:hypothetical protein
MRLYELILERHIYIFISFIRIKNNMIDWNKNNMIDWNKNNMIH